MIRLHGKSKGEKLKPVQFANDWIMCESPRKPNEIVRPTAVQLEPEDFEVFDKELTAHSSGTFWLEWELLEDGRFRSLRPGGGLS